MKTILLYTTDKGNAFAEIAHYGGRVTQIFTSCVFIAQMPDDFETQRLEKSSTRIPSRLDKDSRRTIKSWQLYQSKLSRKSAVEFGPPKNFLWGSDDFPAPKTFMRPVIQTVSGITRSVPTSAYMIGSIAVGVVIVSGPGVLKFTRSEEDKIISEIQEGLDFLSTEEPKAQVQFQYEIAKPQLTVPQVLVGNEAQLEAPWRDAALTTLGASSSAEYVDRLKATYNTRWAFVVFIVKYNVAYFAYTNRERIVINYNSLINGPDYLNSVFVHETGHVFGAGDEYAPCQCTDRFGFLDILNSNCNACPGLHYACVMMDTGLALCPSTRRQIGWDTSLYP